MPQKLLLIASIITLSLLSGRNALGQWVETTGPANVQCFAATSTGVLAGGQPGLFITTDTGRTWSLAGLDSDLVNSLFIYGGKIFASTANYGLLVSSDEGVNWIPDTDGMTAVVTLYNIGVSEPNLIAGTNKGVFVSSDTGISWKQTLNLSYTHPIAADDQSAYTISINKFYYSDDHGLNWTAETWPGFTYDMALLDGELFAGESTGNGIFVSNDHGATWSSVDSGLVFSAHFDVHKLAKSGENIFLSSDLGVFLTTDKGAHWTNETDSAVMEDTLPLNVFGLLPYNGVLFGGAADSVWIRPLSQMIATSSVQNTQAPSEYLDVSPNPFSEYAKISFSTTDGGPAEVTIVNILGSEVKQIFSGEIAVGEHSFTLNANGMPPGMYECIVRSNGRAEEMPIVLLQ